MPTDPIVPYEATQTNVPAAADGDNDNMPRPPLTPAAERALAEAQARREAAAAQAKAAVPEVGGRAGPDPVRYGDWESGGIAWDF
jgi:hypothetical protein